MQRSREKTRGVVAFTIVELLVVIGVIGVLVALLLPALIRARDSARTVKCLSNLRQIGQAISLYAGTGKGYLLPYEFDPNGPHWANILIEGKYIGGRGVDDLDAVSPQQMETVLYCPSGSDQMLNGTPADYFDSKGSNFVRMLNPGTDTAVDVWYGVNGGDGSPFEPDGDFRRFPFRVIPSWRGSGSPVPDDYRMHHLSDISNAAQIALVFDGALFAANNPCMINARHQRRTVTNVLLADMHAESIQASSLPQGLLDDPAVIAQAPFPRWRMDP